MSYASRRLPIFQILAVLCTHIHLSWTLSISWPLDAPTQQIVNISWSGQPPFQLSVRQHYYDQYLELANFQYLNGNSLTWPVTAPVGNHLFLVLTDATGQSIASQDLVVQAPNFSSSPNPGDPASSSISSAPASSATDSVSSSFVSSTTTTSPASSVSSTLSQGASGPPPQQTTATFAGPVTPISTFTRSAPISPPTNPAVSAGSNSETTTTQSKTTGFIVGGIFGAIVLIAFLFFILSSWIRRRRNKKPYEDRYESDSNLVQPDEKFRGRTPSPEQHNRSSPVNEPPPPISLPITANRDIERQLWKATPDDSRYPTTWTSPGASSSSPQIKPQPSSVSRRSEASTASGAFFPSQIPYPPRPKPTHQPKPPKKLNSLTLPSNPAVRKNSRNRYPQNRPSNTLQPQNLVQEAPFLVLKTYDPLQEAPQGATAVPRSQRGSRVSGNTLTYPPPVEHGRRLYPREGEGGRGPPLPPLPPNFPPSRQQTPGAQSMDGSLIPPLPSPMTVFNSRPSTVRASLPVPPPERSSGASSETMRVRVNVGDFEGLTPHSARPEFWEESLGAEPSIPRHNARAL